MKYRVEKKYICNAKELAIIQSRLKILMKSDPNVNIAKEYTVKSVYFDDYQNSGFYDNQSGINARSKYRIRTYNNDLSTIKLEVKSKLNTYTNKISCPLSLIQAKQAILNHNLPNISDMSPAYSKTYLKMKIDLLKPVVTVEYVREPYVYKEGNVRITLDKNITASSCTKDFFTNSNNRIPLLPSGSFVLEVKYDGFLPTHIYNALNLKNMDQTAFSKYYLSRLMLKNTFFKTI